jgi:hypothetical protein
MPSFSKRALYLVFVAPVLAAAVAVGCSDGTQTGGGSASTQSSGSASTGSAGGGTGGTDATGTGGTGAAGTGGTGAAGTGGIGGGGTGGIGTGGIGGIGGGGTGGIGGTGGGTPVIASCGNQVYQCGNTIDDDKDGLIDSQDPDCLGPCDNTENNFYGGIPGQAGPSCIVDCYWDSNSGAGNDNCYWNHQCDPLSTDPNYYPETWNGSKCAYNKNTNTPGTSSSCDELQNTQSSTCEKECAPLTPNGCDCFGCCELPAGGGKFVWLGSEDGMGNGSCTLKDLADPTKCAPCTPVKGFCYNECGKCELCIGKDTLPPECFPNPGSSSASSGAGGSGTGGSGGSTAQCPDGEQACGLAGQAPCPGGYYCITGCCILQPK